MELSEFQSLQTRWNIGAGRFDHQRDLNCRSFSPSRPDGIIASSIIQLFGSFGLRENKKQGGLPMDGLPALNVFISFGKKLDKLGGSGDGSFPLGNLHVFGEIGHIEELFLGVDGLIPGHPGACVC